MRRNGERGGPHTLGRKITLWFAAAFAALWLAAAVSLAAGHTVLAEFDTMLQDSTACYNLQAALDAEAKLFEAYARDPSRANRLGYEQACADTARCILLEARNGREALALAEAERPQAAILDIEMPGVSGLDVARAIREQQIPCVLLFLTAYDNFDYARQAIAVKALDYLLKPYKDEELLLAVEEALHVYDRLQQHDLFREYNLNRLASAQPPAGDPPAARTPYGKEKIRRYIEENYASDLSMQETARVMGYSEAYFCKLFKDCFHINFSAYLNEYRIRQAKQMLTGTNREIKDIGRACGYSDAGYFARVFKRVTGLTPSEYRASDQT